MAAAAKATLPNDPILVRLLRAAKRCPGTPIIADVFGFTKSYNELLADIFRTRDLLRRRLPPSALDERGLVRDDAPYVSILSKNGYEFAVAFFAARAIGGASIPLASGAMPEEVAYFLGVSKSSCLLVGREYLEKAEQSVASTRELHNIDVLPLVVSSDAEPLDPADIEIDEGLALDSAGPGLVIFTSGTTGSPKGAVLPRQCMCYLPDAEPGSETICFRPPHWLGGLISYIIPLIIGSKVHLPGELATPEQLWAVFLNNPINNVVFTPVILRTLKEYLEEQSPEVQERLLGSLKLLIVINSSGSMLSPPLMKFWTEKTRLPFSNIYGSTETGGYASHKVFFGTEITNSIGNSKYENIKIRLSEGDHGEVLVKSPFMLIRYLGAEEKTKTAFDADGYLKTGDYAEFRDGEYYYCGRSSVDYIRYQGFTIPTVQVEMALTSLPYVAAACVLGIPDHESKEICGAVLLLTPEARALQSGPARITLQTICDDLRPLLPPYMHPVLLRLIQSHEEMPQTVSQKPIKRLVVKQCFGVEEYWNPEDPAPGVEWRHSIPVYVKEEVKAWDWGGLQFYQEAQS